jgi:hypothetical protein
VTSATIDLALAGTEDGVPVYAPPWEAVSLQIARGIAWLLANYPREFLHGLGLVAVGVTCIYLARDPAPRPSRRRR